MLRIALINQKGGVGKTTSVLNIGACLAKKGLRVLMVDMDGQRNLSGVFDKADEKENIYTFLMGTSDLNVVEVKPNLMLCPGSDYMHTLDVMLGRQNPEAPGLVLKSKLTSGEYALEEHIDVVLFDCPPKLDLNTLNTLAYVEWVFIPVMADNFSLEGVTETVKSVMRFQKGANKDLKIGGMFFVRFDPRATLYSQLRTRLETLYGGLVLEHYTRENVALRECVALKMDIYSYDETMEKTSNGALDYEKITNEILMHTRYEISTKTLKTA